MYIKIASIIEILLGLAMAGLGVFALLLSGATPGPAAIAGLILGVPMILLSILLIVFGISLWRLKKWAWLASIVTLVILIIAIAFFIVGLRAYSQPVPIFLCAGAIICLILLISGIREIFPAKRKIESLQKIQIEKRIGVSWKKLKFLKPSFAKILATVILTLPIALAHLTATGERTPALIIVIPFLYIAFPVVVLLSKIIPSTYPDFPGALITIIILALYYYILVCLVVLIYKKISGKIGGGQKIKTFFIPNKEKTILFIVLSVLIGCWYWTNLYNPLRPLTVDILKGLLILPLSYLVSCIIFGIWGKDRRKILIVVLIVVALIAVGAIGYYFYKEKKAEEPIDETADLPSKDLSTKDWKVYQNEGHGFSFSYPENFQLLENDFGRGSVLASVYIEEPILFSLVLLQDMYMDSAQTPQISIDVVKTNKTIGQLLDHVRKIINEQAKVLENPGAPYYGSPPPEIISVETITIGDLETTKVVHDRGPGGPNSMLLEYYIAYPGYAFVFSAYYGNPCSPGYCGETEKEILPIILSTFKFIEDETADRKVYQNEKYGFEIKYPSEWVAGAGTLSNNFVFGESDWSNTAKVNITVYTESFLDKIYKEEAKERICTTVVLSAGEAYRCEGTDFIYLEAEHNGKFYLWSVFGTKESEKFKIFDQILSTFKFIEIDETVQISVIVDIESFDLENKTFEGWVRTGEKGEVKVITTDSTEFYRTSTPEWKKEYFTFTEFCSNPPRNWPVTIKGIFEEEGVIKAQEVFIISQ